MAKKAKKESIPAAESGHDFQDTSVLEFGVKISDLMLAFDNAGVAIAEEQFRAIPAEDARIAIKWVNDTKIGAIRPVPNCLRPFASKELIDQSDDYLADQREQRKVLMNCKYGKPSPTKPEGDDGEPKIKMTVIVPLDEVRPGTADELWGGVRCQIDFSLRPANEMQSELPGTESTLSCVAEIKGYSRKMHDWQFSFLVLQSVLSVKDAFDRFWTNSGSCRVTSLGVIDKDDEEDDDSHVPTPPVAAKTAQPSLFDPEPKKAKSGNELSYRENLKGDEFISPEEYIVPMASGDKNNCIITIGESQDRFYSSATLVFLDDEGEQQEADWMNPTKTGDGSHSVKSAIEKELGTLIQYFAEKVTKYAATKVIDDLRAELKRLESGGEPHLMPDE